MKIIGLSGKLGSGKGTITKIFQNLNNDIKEVFFAEKLKRIVALLANIDYELTLTQEGKNIHVETYEMSVGEMLQKIGHIFNNHFDKLTWVKAIDEIIDPDKIYIISDCRLLTEVNFIKEKGGIIIRINRKNNDIADKSKRNLNDISETEIDNYNFDYIIDNSGTYEELVDKVTNLYKDIFNI